MKKGIIVSTLLFFACVMRVHAEEIISFSSDSTWKSSKTITAGWINLDYDDSAWIFAKSPSIGTCTLGKQKPSFATPMWHPKPIETQTAYFRKNFNIVGKPLKAKMIFAFDDDGEVYINGKKVFVDSSGRTEVKEITMDILEHIIEGKNTIALKVTDPRGGCQWVQVYVEIQVEPPKKYYSPLFLQIDPTWKDDVYAGGARDKLDCGKTIGQCGCSVTALAMLLQGYGITKGPLGDNVDPRNLNTYFLKDQKCSEAGCISLGYVFGAVRWSAVHGYSMQAHELYNTPKIQYFGQNIFDKGAIQSKIQIQKRPIIAKDPKRSHWFILAKEMENDFEILDPYYGKTTLNTQYQGGADRTLDYQEVHSDFSAIEIYTKRNVLVHLFDQDGKEIAMTKFEEEYPESSSSGELQHYIFTHPSKGEYVIKASGINIAIYISDQNGSEKFQLTQSNKTKITYDPENIFTSEIHEVPALLACIGKPLPLYFPIIFTVKADRDYVYKGELVAHELLESVAE